jgi:hypothetical protein
MCPGSSRRCLLLPSLCRISLIINGKSWHTLGHGLTKQKVVKVGPLRGFRVLGPTRATRGVLVHVWSVYMCISGLNTCSPWGIENWGLFAPLSVAIGDGRSSGRESQSGTGQTTPFFTQARMANRAIDNSGGSSREEGLGGFISPLASRGHLRSGSYECVPVESHEENTLENGQHARQSGPDASDKSSTRG